MARRVHAQARLRRDITSLLPPESGERILITRAGVPTPMIAASEPGHLAAVIAPGIVAERHQFSVLEVSQHFHPTHCLHLQTAGVTRVHWRGGGRSGSETMRASSLMLHGQGTGDSTAFAGKSSRVVVSFDPAVMKKMMGDESERRFLEIPSRWHFQDPQLERLVRNLEVEVGSGLPSGRIYGELLGLSLFEYLVQHYGGDRPLQAASKGGLPKRMLDRVVEYIAANLSQPLSVAEVATVAGMSSYHFARLFKASTGVSPHQYVLAQRIERAKRLLAAGQSNVIDVALDCGFNDQSYFSRVFRRAAGVPPLRYSREVK